MSQTCVREVPVFESLLRHHPDWFYHGLSQFYQGDSSIIFREATAVFFHILSSLSCTGHPISFYLTCVLQSQMFGGSPWWISPSWCLRVAYRKQQVIKANVHNILQLNNPFTTNKCKFFFFYDAHSFWKSNALLEDVQALTACPSDKKGIKMEMDMEYWWNDTDRGKQ